MRTADNRTTAGKPMKKILFLYRDLICIDRSHHSTEADLTSEEILVLIQGQPDEYRLSDDMILRHETPIAAICRVVPIIPHHEIIVHLEGVGIGRPAVCGQAMRAVCVVL